MPSTQSKTRARTSDPQSWRRTSDRRIVEDDLIAAWEKGKKDGVKELEKLAMRELESNMNQSHALTSELLGFIKKKGMNAKSAWLKLQSWNDMKVLVLMPPTNMLNDSIYEVYSKITELESRVDYVLSFSLVSAGSTLNMDRVESDGYVYQYLKG